MKITCEHCGSSIDILNDKKCTNCGAPYKNNKEYKEMMEYNKKMRQANLESRELGNEIIKNTLTSFKSVSIIGKVIGIISFIIIITVIITMITMIKR